MKHVYLQCPHYATAKMTLEAAMDEWCAAMRSRDDQGGVCSYDDALRWIHSDE
jgi:hypothetical protein